MKTIYFDNAATTALDSRVLESMLPWLKSEYGNASSIHHLGRKAQVAVEESREKIAHYLGCKPAEIIFTSGGTESDNTAIFGVLETGFRSEIITSNAEHHAVLHPVEQATTKNYTSRFIQVDHRGICTPDALKRHISNDTALVSLMHVNNENGAINPINELAAIAHSNGALFHSDLVQSAGKMELNVKELDIDFGSISGHKIYGPKGIGVLYVRSGVDWRPFMLGGSQERKRRGGTLNVPGIVGLGKAFELAHEEMNERSSHILALKNKLQNQLLQHFGSHIQFNNPQHFDAYHIVNISFILPEDLYLDGEMLLLNLDIEGICCSNGSACTSGAVEPSHVLLAMGIPAKIAKSSLRISLGKNNTAEEIDYFVEKLKIILKRMTHGYLN